MTERTHPSVAKGVQVGSADAAVGDSDVNVGLLPLLGLKLGPDHLSIGRRSVERSPTLKLISHLGDLRVQALIWQTDSLVVSWC